MKMRFKILLIFIGITFSVWFYYWNFGAKFGPPIWNESKTYYLQAYKTYSIVGQAAMPGQGSALESGYYVLYNKDGKRLDTSKKMNISLAEIHWIGREVILMGEVDDTLRLE